jgi:hypothetical protein
VSDHIRALQGTEPESIRYAVLGYLSSMLLNQESSLVLTLIEIFSPSWMYSGRAGLVASCFMAYKSV